MTLRLLRIAVVVSIALTAMGGVQAADSSKTQFTTQPTQTDAHAGTRGTSVVSGKIERTFGQLAGSPDNASNLVAGLRNGSQVTLTEPPAVPGGPPTEVTFQPPTRPMGWGNVRTSLALAQTQLAGYGITQPSAQQLAASLNGGPITVIRPDGTTQTVQLQGVLQLRASGMGWGEIAHAYGTKLGPVISGLKPNGSTTAHPVATPHSAGTSASRTSAATGASPARATGSGVTSASGWTASTAAGLKTAAPDGAKGHGKGTVSATGSSVGGSAAAGGGTGIATAAGGLGMGAGHSHGRGIGTAGGGRGGGVVTAAGGGTSGVVTAAGGVPGGGIGAASMSAYGGSGVVNATGGAGHSGQGLAKGHYK